MIKFIIIDSTKENPETKGNPNKRLSYVYDLCFKDGDQLKQERFSKDYSYPLTRAEILAMGKYNNSNYTDKDGIYCEVYEYLDANNIDEILSAWAYFFGGHGNGGATTMKKVIFNKKKNKFKLLEEIRVKTFFLKKNLTKKQLVKLYNKFEIHLWREIIESLLKENVMASDNDDIDISVIVDFLKTNRYSNRLTMSDNQLNEIKSSMEKFGVKLDDKQVDKKKTEEALWDFFTNLKIGINYWGDAGWFNDSGEWFFFMDMTNNRLLYGKKRVAYFIKEATSLDLNYMKKEDYEKLLQEAIFDKIGIKNLNLVEYTTVTKDYPSEEQKKSKDLKEYEDRKTFGFPFCSV